jgi:uncharacterized peroxidase-related enzyme
MAPDARVYDLFARRPELFEPFTEFCERLMRGPSALEPAERELLGAYVSSLNRCEYCQDVHAEAVRAYGVAPAVIEALRAELPHPDISPRVRTLAQLARRATLEPTRVVDEDFEACRAQGCDEDSILDALLVASLFNFMNRLVSALGIEADAAYLAAAGPRLRDHGYLFSLQSRLDQAE